MVAVSDSGNTPSKQFFEAIEIFSLSIKAQTKRKYTVN
jgi:hypothetical protein